MPTNPLSGIITTEFKTLFVNAMNALLEDAALTVPCRFDFGTTKNTECPNCIIDTITGRSTNQYNGTGSSSFPNGSICPQCGGAGLIPVDTTETLNLVVLYQWSKSKWIQVGDASVMANSEVQTISKLSSYSIMRECKEAVFDTNVEQLAREKYRRVGRPFKVGYGDTSYVITMWSMI